MTTKISHTEPNVYFYRYPILTIDSNEAGNGIMSYSAELKLQLGHVDKLEFNMLRKNNYVNLTTAKIPSWYIANMSDCLCLG